MRSTVLEVVGGVSQDPDEALLEQYSQRKLFLILGLYLSTLQICVAPLQGRKEIQILYMLQTIAHPVSE